MAKSATSSVLLIVGGANLGHSIFIFIKPKVSGKTGIVKKRTDSDTRTELEPQMNLEGAD